MMKRVAIALILLLMVGGLSLVGVGYWFTVTPPSTNAEQIVVVVPKGAPLARVAQDLAAAGIVKHGRAFRYFVKWKGKAAAIKPGEYAFTRDMTPQAVMEKLVAGDTIKYRVTIPEGFAMRDIVKLVADARIAPRLELARLSEDPAFAEKLKVPAKRLEGYLFPDTYSFERNEAPETVLGAMVERWRSEWKPEFDVRAAELRLSMHEVMTLASIIEKETGRADERPLISGVFHHRMSIGMKLQTDPTVIYGIPNYEGDIRFSHLKDRSNPYNTYVIPRLPPGPIASPGAKAIEAALWPAPTKSLYFVARSDGSHAFSRTFAEHNAWVKKFQSERRALDPTPTPSASPEEGSQPVPAPEAR